MSIRRLKKTAADMIVPVDRFAEMMETYRRGFESRGLDYAVWGTFSDGNVHPNVIPRSYDDVVRGKEAILDFGRAAAATRRMSARRARRGAQSRQAAAANPAVR
jgi:FAD/FMN-containing dehydrogenase